MCNAYEVGGRRGSFSGSMKAKAIRSLVAQKEKKLIRRTDRAPVIRDDGELVEMSWGFRRSGLGVVNNSRADKLDSPMWKTAFEKHRCVIPVAGFYEWSGPKGRKRTHYFEGSEANYLWMAGIWEESQEFGECFSMITTQANSFMMPIHHRMPAILNEAQLEPYLAGEVDSFVPKNDMLTVRDAPNPLVKAKSNLDQPELFD